jgi:asparagine synthase (glutamine-hydrolysing)
MCGIAGYLHFRSEKLAGQETLSKMISCLAHRGPDGQGMHVDKNLALGHRRLSIIDLSSGHQPMYSDDGKIVLVFNGEIYNYLELRSELKTLGYVFKTSSDTEVIIKAYQHWGIDCQKKFNGMWAFALYDSNNSELYLSRDRIGEKPLFYSVFNGTLVFGSEIKSLFAYGVDPEINKEIIELYLFLTYIPAPFTFYKTISKIKPGHFLKIKDGTVRDIKYWDIPIVAEENLIRDKEFVYKKFGELFEDAVKLRMRSDVPFGAFLSGGLDSSSVVAVMSKHGKFPVQTFTIGFNDSSFDESELARKVANAFNTDHHTGTVSPDDFENALLKVKFHFDEPFGDSSAIPTAAVSRFASSRVKMVLTGDGGDEILSGYNSYLGVKITELYQRLPVPIQKLIPVILGLLSKPATNRARYRLNRMIDVSQTAMLPFNARMARKMAYTDYGLIKQLVGTLKVISIEDFLSDFYKNFAVKEDFYKLMLFDFKHNLPDDYLVKVDRMTMASSLEARVPFLDYRLVEFMVGVDKTVKLQGWETKAVLRKTVGKTLPVELLQAPKKGFGIPVREWFKSDTFNSHFEKLQRMPYLNPEAIKEIIEDNRSGRRDNGNFIWTLSVLNEFV